MSIRVRMHIREGISRGLCGSCRYSHRHKYNNDVEDVRCVLLNMSNNGQITRPVVECNDYEDFGKPSMQEMENKAWIIEVRGGRVMGFNPPKKEDDTD